MITVKPYIGEFRSSCGQGSVAATGAELYALFGQPGDSDGYKVSHEWNLIFSDGTYATIYDWKICDTYGDGGMPKEQVLATNTDWHIGGDSKHAVELIQQFLDGYRENPTPAIKPLTLLETRNALKALVSYYDAYGTLDTDTGAQYLAEARIVLGR